MKDIETLQNPYHYKHYYLNRKYIYAIYFKLYKVVLMKNLNNNIHFKVILLNGNLNYNRYILGIVDKIDNLFFQKHHINTKYLV